MSLFKRYVDVQPVDAGEGKVKVPVKTNEYIVMETKLQNYLLEELKKKQFDRDEETRKIRELGKAFIDKEGERLTFEEKKSLLGTVEHELLGYGPITPLLEDSTVSEIMVNGPFDIYYEHQGKILKSESSFRDDAHVERVIERIVSPLGRRIDESSPMVDARLPDGSRVNAVIPPLALRGPSLTIRKFSATPFQIYDLIDYNTLSTEMADFLSMCVKSRLNIFISGGTGSGKTSSLNVLSSFIPNDERIVTIEDAAELQLSQDHIVALESRPSNIEGTGAITIRDLVRNALRMRPDRIVVGEVRGAEALDMLQAMNTGHDGSLSSGHANSPRDMLSRLETMVLMAGFDLPLRAIREQIANALDLIVHQVRLKDGSRKMVKITEVLGMEGETIVLQDLFVFKEEGRNSKGKIEGRFVSTGVRPGFAEVLEQNEFTIPASWFKEEW
ncbi:CpaF family protein [Alkalihalobacillus sp. CinArs1]|uniref:CpaF family protein n=1 Tax=Alkalihalobacillus sp. CinArs1 TaxID=2995314 RepID=UPI0022DDDED8|nr:CpaF family protein [Alkalihalobacillus sp. CinArs1]